MTIDDFIPTTAESQLPTDDSPASPTSLPPDCAPNQFLNWRAKYALHLVDQADGSSMTHDDPWVQAMVDFGLVSLSKHRPTTQMDLAIFRATELWKSDSLAKHVLEARLLAQETPDEISARCGLSPLTITAYANLYFDVCGPERKSIWLMRPFASTVAANTEVAQLGWRLKNLACFSSVDEVERYITTLQRIEGATLAAGLSAHGDSASMGEIVPRLAVAKMLLLMSPSAEKLLQKFITAAANDVLAFHTTPASMDLAMNVLRKVKVPTSIRQELRLMRQGLAKVPETDVPVSA